MSAATVAAYKRRKAKESAETSEPAVCSECGNHFSIRDGADDDHLCDPCAHVVAARFRALLERVVADDSLSYHHSDDFDCAACDALDMEILKALERNP